MLLAKYLYPQFTFFMLAQYYLKPKMEVSCKIWYIVSLHLRILITSKLKQQNVFLFFFCLYRLSVLVNIK